MAPPGTNQTQRKIPLGTIAAFCLLYLALALPNDIRNLDATFLLPPPVELFVIIALAAILPRRLHFILGTIVGIALALIVVFKLADMVTYEALSRRFVPLLDMHLLPAAWNLVSGAFGALLAGLVVLGAVLVTAIVVVGIIAALHKLFSGVGLHRFASGALAAGFLLAAFALATLLPEDRSYSLASNANWQFAQRHGDAFMASIGDLDTFREEARNDPVAAIETADLLTAVADRDVIMLFVESYGRTVLDNPDYSAHVRPVLDDFDAMLARQGLAAATGFKSAPVAGGQSWLAHASILSGLWVNTQQRYNSLLISRRETMIDDFNRIGHRSVAVMPAITMPWPEGESFGYDAIYNAEALGYRGEPFNWVTMPDQYTLSAFDRLERQREDREPLFAEIALISSHAPWTPIPEIVDWDDVGDGTIFTPQALGGETPQEVWSDMDKVRVQYRLSIEYALANISSWIEERLDAGFVLVVLGDHQPSRNITGPTDSRDVPYHIISDDTALIDDLRSRLALSPGMIPSAEQASHPMDAFRARFVGALSEGQPASGGADDGLGPT